MHRDNFVQKYNIIVDTQNFLLCFVVVILVFTLLYAKQFGCLQPFVFLTAISAFDKGEMPEYSYSSVLLTLVCIL